MSLYRKYVPILTSVTVQRNTAGISHTVRSILDHSLHRMGTACVLLRWTVCCVGPSLTLLKAVPDVNPRNLYPTGRLSTRNINIEEK
jgi:hypothetical protein